MKNLKETKETKGKYRWEQVSVNKLFLEVGRAYKRGKIEILLEEGYGYSEIAKRVDSSESTVRAIANQVKN